MNTLNLLPFRRPAMAASLVSMAVMLAACGGGAEDDTTAAVTSAQGAGAEMAQSAEDAAAPRALPAAWELAEDPATEQAFLTSQLSRAARETAMNLATDTRTKWNPGHYIATGKRDPATVAQILSEIKDIPQVKGLLLRYDWAQLETAKGVYDFSKIDRDLAAMAAANKRLFIMVGTKVFTPGGRAVPDYLRTAEYEGGAYKILIGAREAIDSSTRYGENAALHNAKVRDRLIALTTALGQRYNGHNAFEGVTFNETAIGNALVPPTAAQLDAYFANLARVNTATKQAFPNTVVMQFINFPRPYMPGLIANMVNSKVGLGGPDIFLEDWDHNTRVYPMYDPAKGQVPIGPSVQPENYQTTVQRGPVNPPKIADLYSFGRTRLNANYMFWTRSFIGTPSPYPQALQFFKSSAMPKDAAGGLTTTCPATFTSCVPKL
ncbi:glycoside hydrolase [Azohydromonas aeria]|uniref:glycoside hydrolase n=1 Tax=Azohydromonas aeria TaxID=2590212 RepID=UPI0012F9F059|nr:glycoside hydrolase [Azohydromonas aeria]